MQKKTNSWQKLTTTRGTRLQDYQTTITAMEVPVVSAVDVIYMTTGILRNGKFVEKPQNQTKTMVQTKQRRTNAIHALNTTTGRTTNHLC